MAQGRVVESESPRIVVVGGGIAGLSAAYRLVELGKSRGTPVDLILLEARDRLGGIISTERIDGYLVEGGPDSFLTEKPWARALCDRVGLSHQLIPTQGSLRRTFVVRCGRLVPLPDGFLVLAPSRLGPVLRSPLLSWRGRLRLAMDLVLPSRRSGEDESVGAFVTRRFGRELLDRVVQPLVSGIYAADPFAVSLSATMPQFAEMERRHGSVIRALRRSRDRSRAEAESGPRWSLFVTLAGGMEDLVSAVARRLPPSSVRLRQRVASIARSNGPRPCDPRAGRRPAGGGVGSGPRPRARGDSVCVVGARHPGVPSGGDRPRARRVWIRGAAGGRAADPCRHVFEPQIPRPGSGWGRPGPGVPRRGARPGPPGSRRCGPRRNGPAGT
ncbi:MAG: protoporphyrinogen oxidase [Bacillati bacterium ANGP1]|uniref:Coproporphyrinogen III oxidase n=1 Tax=Candidatus Segetimicrobium genomatis TaxID=2569760 RepID=A0A537JAS7_9BACT|nr:MAG: protoporphyrinogen oxidase [Terrabacteria group bacterium ANGP1]